MKTKKVLALLVLAAMLLSILPVAAFAATTPVFNIYASSVSAPEGSVEAQADGYDPDKDGQEFILTLVGVDGTAVNGADGRFSHYAITDSFFVASSRASADRFFYGVPGTTDDFYAGSLSEYASTGAYRISDLAFEHIAGATYAVKIKVVSSATGRSQIVFGICPECVADYARGRSIPYASGNSALTGFPHDNHSISNVIIGGQRFPVDYTAPKAENISITVQTPTSTVYANGIDSYTIVAFVSRGTTNLVPISGESVTFSITRGVGGATLTQTRVPTNAAGRAETKLYSTRAGNFVIRASISGTWAETDPAVTFASTGVVSIKAESGDNQKVARGDATETKWFSASAYDSGGNRMDFLRIAPADATGLPIVTTDTGYPWVAITKYMTDKNNDWGGPNLQATIVSAPSGAAIKDTDIKYRTNSNGDFQFGIEYGKLNKDGIYEVRIYLINGSSVSYSFDVRDLGDVANLRLNYTAVTYSAGTVVPEPFVVQINADGYELNRAFSAWKTRGNNFSISVGDASFMDGRMNENASFKLKDDKSGPLVMTLVDADRSMVATQNLTIHKPASYLKLTPSGVGAVGTEVTVNIELVDIDGNLAATGLGADYNAASGAIINPPEGVVASVNSIDASNFANGKATARVTSNANGDITLQVIIREVEKIVEGSGIVNQAARPARPSDNYWYDNGGTAGSTAALIEDDVWFFGSAAPSTDYVLAFGTSGSTTVNTMPAAALSALAQAAVSGTTANGLLLDRYNDYYQYANYSTMLVAAETYGGRTYTGACTVTFGEVAGGGTQLIFFIGGVSYVAGNKPFAAQSPAFIEGDYTYLGIRDMANAIGAPDPIWDEAAQTVTITKDNITIVVTVGSSEMSVTKGGATSVVPIPAAAINRDGRVYLPFRALLEQFGYTVDWDGSTQSIVCTI